MAHDVEHPLFSASTKRDRQIAKGGEGMIPLPRLLVQESAFALIRLETIDLGRAPQRMQFLGDTAPGANIEAANRLHIVENIGENVRAQKHGALSIRGSIWHVVTSVDRLR